MSQIETGLILEVEKLKTFIEIMRTQEFTILQMAAGAPVHVAGEGTLYWDITLDNLWINNCGAGGAGSWTLIGGGAPPVFHNILSATHTDTIAAVVVRGDVMTGQAGPAWARVAHPGAAGQYLRANAADPGWSAIQLADLPAHNLLSATHPDTVVQAPSVGSLIYGDNTPDWNELVHPGAAGYAFITTATQVVWDQTPAWTGLHTFGAGWDLTGGTGDLNGLDLIIDADGDTYLHEVADDHIEFVLAGASGQLDININGVDDFTFTANSLNVLAGSYITMADDTWIGLGAGAGRIAFDSTPAPDTLFVYDANLDVQHHGAIGAAAAIAANEILEVNEVFTDTTGDIYGIYTLLEAEPGSAFTTNFHAIFGHARLDTAQIGAGFLAGVEGFASVDDGIAANITTLAGGYFYTDVEDSTVGSAFGVWAVTPAVDNGSATGGAGVYIGQGTVGAGGITTLYGLYIESITAGGTDWAIYTNLGDIHFGDDVEMDDGAGDSPQLRFIGGSNNDTAYVFLDDNAVAGNSDLVIRLCATDADSQLQIQDSGSNVVAYVDADGNADFDGHGAFGGAATVVTTNVLYVLEAVVANAGTETGVYSRIEAEPNANFTTTFRGVLGYARLDTAETQTSGYLGGVVGIAGVNNTIAATVVSLRGGYFYADVEDATACASAEGVRAFTPYVDTGACTDGYGIRVSQGTVGGGSVTNLYGLHIASITAGSTLNYSIYTAGGEVRHINSVADGGAIAYLYRNQGTVNLPAFYLWLDSTTDDEAAVYVRHDGTGDLIQLYDGAVQVVDVDNTGHVTLNSLTGTTGNTLYVYRNLASGSTNAAVVYFFNDNAGDDQRVLRITQDAVAIALDVNTNSTEEAAFFNRDVDASLRPVVTIVQDHTSGAQPCLLLQQDDISEGFIEFGGSDRGVITESTNSLASVRVELGGVVYRLALYLDA